MKYPCILILALLAFIEVEAQQIANTTWKTYNPTLIDTITVQVTNDSILQYDGANSLLLASLYKQNNDTVFVFDVGGTYMCMSPDTGVYRFTITGDTMLISLISDDCFPRSITFDGVKLWRYDNTSAIHNIQETSISFNLYPNPSQGFVNVKMGHTGMLSVFNEVGQIVLHIDITESPKTLTLNLNKGLYLVKFRSGSQIAHKKLLVE